MILRLAYTYSDNDLPLTITETGVGGLAIADVTFGYDLRGRLTGEERIEYDGQGYPVTVYDLTYPYDAGGNRKTKHDAVSNIKDTYTYDYEDPGEYKSNNNRSMEYETIDVSLPTRPVTLSHTYYLYNGCGNVTRVITNNDPPDSGSSQMMDGGDDTTLGEEAASGGDEPMAPLAPACPVGEHFTATRFFYAQNGTAASLFREGNDFSGWQPGARAKRV